MADDPKEIRRGRLVWGVVLVGVVGGVELLALLDIGDFSTLSAVVIDLTTSSPEWWGGAVALGLGWLLWHWLVAPLWRLLRRSGGDE